MNSQDLINLVYAFGALTGLLWALTSWALSAESKRLTAAEPRQMSGQTAALRIVHGMSRIIFLLLVFALLLKGFSIV